MFQDGSITAILSASCLHITRYPRVEQSSATQHVVSWTSVLSDEGRGARSVKSNPQHPARRSRWAQQAATQKASPAQNVEADEPACSVPNAQARTAGSSWHHWPQSVPSQQFQVLFNSLFKVLFIFPSRYLFAIGLAPIFSFRWNLPPN